MFACYCFRCGRNLFRNETFCPKCGTQRRTTELADIQKCADLSDVITFHFVRGTQYKTIVLFLEKYHDTKMSVRTLKRRLKELGLKKKGNSISDSYIQQIIEREIQSSSSILGYRSMWNKLKSSYGIVTSRDRVMKILREIDPLQSSYRKARKLKRRVFHSSGPNASWHADGYDKLKMYGFPIHGCVDGFSRKVLWLKVCRSNNNPVVPASLYLNAVEEQGIYPKILQTDCGTENGLMASIHSFLHRNVNAHRYGSSVSNQRIENLWSHFKRGYTSWVIDYFKNMVHTDALRIGDKLHMECAWFVYSDFLQMELDKLKREWNMHTIRKSKGTQISGVPDELYFVPEGNGYLNCGESIRRRDISDVLNQINVHEAAKDVLGKADADMTEYFRYVVSELDIVVPPRDWAEARYIYDKIIEVST